MIGIFNTLTEANTFSEKIHNHLLNNRKDYNAEKWCVPDKSDNEEKWSVKIPSDFDKLKITLDVTNIQKISKFPVNWKNAEIMPIEKPIIKK